MPQMAPYNWLILFFLFNLIMIFIISHNHFMLSNKLTKNLILPPLSGKMYLYNWMW